MTTSEQTRNRTTWLITILTILGFSIYFTYDILTLKRALNHPDIYTYYYPYRQWFLSRLKSLDFPIWNPYWGLGHAVEAWGSIPLDPYTLLELGFGPYYHYYQLLQLIAILTVTTLALRRLGYSPIACATGAILFFISPLTMYWFFSFLINSTYIMHAILFQLVWTWSLTGRSRYIPLIGLATALSMLGTKVEMWFYEAFYFTFLILFFATSGRPSPYRSWLARVFPAFCGAALGVFANIWQLNLFLQLLYHSGRFSGQGPLNIASLDLYRNLLLSILESPLWQMLLLALLARVAVDKGPRLWRKPWPQVVALSATWAGVCIFFAFRLIPFALNVLKSPILPAIALGLAISLFISEDRRPATLLRPTVFFLPWVSYWARPGPGGLGEMEIMGLAPSALLTLLAVLVWLGSGRVGRDRAATAAFATALFVLFMRDQGEILLSYLTGLLWIPTRDNYIIDFAAAILATGGLASVIKTLTDRPSKTVVRSIVPHCLSLGVILLVVVATWNNLYYPQVLMREPMPGYPFHQGAKPLRQALRDIRSSDTTRVYFVNYDAWGFSYGFGESLLERVGQITMYDSLTDRRYKDWTIFHRLGIRPEQHWGGYPGGYPEEKIARLPKKNSLGLSNWSYYHHTVIARPPLDANLLALLGVSHVINLHPLTGPDLVWVLDRSQLERELAELKLRNRRDLPGLAKPGIQSSPFIAETSHALPRAFLADGVTTDRMREFQRELAPRVGVRGIATTSHFFQITPVTISRYDPEYVSLKVHTQNESVLVLGDLYHPFWSATVDGRPADIFPALYLFRGVKIPPGEHHVEFRCRIPNFEISALLSTLAALAILGLAARYMLQRNP